MFETLQQPVLDLHNNLREAGGTLSVAESCTGGLLGAAITSVGGSSDVFVGGGITYSNTLKREVLGVEASLLKQHGAVSGPVARRMAAGASRAFDTPYSVGITGIAGPGGGTEEKPVGLVHFGFNLVDELRHERREFEGDRGEVRFRSVEFAIKIMIDCLKSRGVG